MAANNIPVSLGFFKRHTYHEECVDYLLKLKANGNQQVYNKLIKSKNAHESALRSYYEAFYLNPKIREKYHIRLKPVPKEIKDKLLLLPAQDASTSGENSKDGARNTAETDIQDVKKGLDHNSDDVRIIRNVPKKVEHERRILLPTQDVREDVYIVEDDDEPLSSPDTSSTTEEINNKIISPNETSKVKEAKNKAIVEDKNKHNPKVSKASKQVAENVDTSVMYSAPTNLSSREHGSTNKTQNVVVPVESYVNKNTNNMNHEVVAASTIAITDPNPKELFVVNQQKTTSCAMLNSIEEIIEQQKVITGGKTNEPAISNPSSEINNVVQRESNFQESEYGSTCPNNVIQQRMFQAPIISTCNTFKNLPVSFAEFKKYTHHEEIIEQLYKTKAGDNKALYLKYKSSQEAFCNTLLNYYHAFYLFPAIRNILRIRLKPMPNFWKNRLLSIPEGATVTELNNFKMEQLVWPDFNVLGTNEEKLSVDKSFPLLNTVEQKIGPSKSNTSTPSSASAAVITTTENNTESCNTDSKSNSSLERIKRDTNDVIDSPSPKRQKIVQQAEDNSEDVTSTKKLYKNLMPYAHCCPVTFPKFRKYTNVEELFRGHCQTRYNSLKKLPYMLHRAYIFFYLAPENRSLKPFTKLKVLDECPLNLRNKIFEIPKNLYLKGEQNDSLNEDKCKTVTHTTNKITATEEYISQATGSNVKNTVEILENRLLPPAVLSFVSQSNQGSQQCSNAACVFHHISCSDFMNLTNALSVIPLPHEMTVIRTIFKKFIYKVIKEQNSDEKYLITTPLLCKLLKHPVICEKCEHDVQTLLNLDTTASSSTSENDRVSNATVETVIERTRSVTKTVSIEDRAKPDLVINNESSKANQTESLENNCQKEQITSDKQPADLWNYLRTDKMFSKFCQKLLSKLNETMDDSVDFSSDSYKIFLQCNEVPLRKILNDFCDNNEDIVQRILNQVEIYEALQRYYYVKYLTIESFAAKYPVKIKQTGSTERFDSIKLGTEPDISLTIYEENNKNQTLREEKSININAFEKAKRIFFRNVDKTHNLNYILRTTFGYKQLILRTVLSLSYNEFLELTNVYEGTELYTDNHITECMYRYVFRTPLVWPTNLYITLENLCKFLLKKNIRFDDYSSMLVFISPKLLHWSALLSCTNIVDCVKINYEKRTGKLLDTFDVRNLKQECIEYYDRCWKYEKWLGETPIVNQKFCMDLLNDNSKVNITPTKMDTSSSDDRVTEEFYCVLPPNTQEQIKMSPTEKNASNDLLNNSNNAFKSNISLSSCGSFDVVSLGELTKPIKTEPINSKLLSNLLFYEDDNSNMQCLTCEEEIVELDNTLRSDVVEKNLPPIEIDFEDVANSNNSNILKSLTQYTPSSAEQLMQSTQSATSTPIIQFPDVSLKSSGENESQKNELEKHIQYLKPIEPLQEVNIRLESSERFPSISQDTHMFSEDLSAKEANTQSQQGLTCEKTSKVVGEIGDTALDSMAEEQQVNVMGPSTSETIKLFEVHKAGCQSNNSKSRLPLRQCITKTNTTTKSLKNIATVKPLKNSGLIPQIQHNTRPLQTIPAYSTGSRNDNQALPPVSVIRAPTSVMLSLTPTSNSVNSAGQSTQNSAIHLELSNLGIHISQELNENCSVFDNSSLLRLVDHNYHKQAKTSLCSSGMSQTGVEGLSKNTGEIEGYEHLPVIINQHQQPEQRSTYVNSMCPDNSTKQNSVISENDNEQLDNKTNKQLVRRVTRTNSSSPNRNTHLNTGSQQPSGSRIVTRRISRLYNTNDKVNNIVLTQTNNLVASITLTIHQPQHRFHYMVRKLCLYRDLIKFHYFKELTPQHISKYLLPRCEIGKSYSEAAISCENFKTRISNTSILTLFPFWSQNMQRDFLTVLDDLKEFHYDVFDRVTMRNQEDLRARILYWLLNTAPSFSLCQFFYDINNPDFSYCEPLNNGNNPSYKRMPFKCLTNALSPKILRKLRKIKMDLNSNCF